MDPSFPSEAAVIQRVWQLSRRRGGQTWQVTTQRFRRQPPYDVRKPVLIAVGSFDEFPTEEEVEQLVYALGYGGGAYRIWAKQPRTPARTIQIEGDPTDPLGDETGRHSNDPIADIKKSLIRAYARSIESDPEQVAELGRAIVESQMGLKLSS